MFEEDERRLWCNICETVHCVSFHRNVLICEFSSQLCPKDELNIHWKQTSATTTFMNTVANKTACRHLMSAALRLQNGSLEASQH